MFTKQLIENAPNKHNLFENTKIDKIERTENGFVAITNFKERIYCKKIVIATGYNLDLIEQNLCMCDISYTIITNPLPELKIKNNALVQDDKEPYHYMRLLPDARIIFGGEDTASKGKNIDEKVAKKKYRKLYKDLCKMFPDFADKIRVEYSFCGYFGWTDDNLGLIGESKFKDIYYMISCGANGVINAFAGAKILLDLFSGKENPLIPLFSPTRET